MREHGQYLAPAAEGLAVAIRPVQIGVQQGPESIPVTRDDRCLRYLLNVFHVDIITRAAQECSASQRLPKHSVIPLPA